MKKILIVLLILLTWSCQPKIVPVKSRYVPVNVGSAPNDGTGDNLRAAFQKVNAGFVDVYDSLGNIYREVQVRTLLHDSIDALKAAALDATDYVYVKSDSNTYKNPITRTWFETYGGGGGGSGTTGKFYILSGQIDQSGFPDAGDSTLLHTNFIGKHITVFREGNFQQQHAENTETDGYRFNNLTGELTFRPVLGANEQVEIWATNTIQWEALIPEGGGGEAESSLLTGLLGFWQFNETSGSSAADALGVYNGTITGALVNQAGKFGTAFDFDGIDDAVRMGTASALRSQTMTVSVWVKTTATAYGAIVANYRYTGSVAYGYGLVLFPDGTVEWSLRYSGSNNIIQSTTAVNDGAWHNIIATFDGTNTNIYVDNDASEATSATAGTIIYHATNQFEIGNRDASGDICFDGAIDAPGLWSKVVSSGERTILFTQTHPW